MFRAATRDDAAAWVRLMAAVAEADATGEAVTEPDYDDMFSLQDADMERNSRLWWHDAVGIAAFGLVSTATAHTDLNRVMLYGVVHPAWRRRGIGRELLEWQEDRGRALHTERHAGLAGVFEIESHGLAGHVALLTQAGYEPARYWYEMRRDLRLRPLEPAGRLPVGLTLQPYDRDIDDALHSAHDDAFADHWGFIPRDRDFWQTWMVGRSLRPDLSSVVFDGEDIAAYILVRHWPEAAALRGFSEVWVAQVGTRPAWRGRGLAGALLDGVIEGAAGQGFDCVTLSVDTANPTGALGLYERRGFEVAREAASYEKAL